MRDRFDELRFGVAVLFGEVEVEHELVGVAHRRERSDGDQAALFRGQLGALPYVAEQDVIGVANEGRGEVTEQALRARWLLGVWHQGSFLWTGRTRSVVAAA